MPRPELRRPPTPSEAYAERKARRTRREYLRALRAVLETGDGRQVLSHLLQAAGVYRSIWTQSAEIHYRAGRQDFGHEIQLDLVAASDELYEQMERESRARFRREEAEDEAFEHDTEQEPVTK